MQGNAAENAVSFKAGQNLFDGFFGLDHELVEGRGGKRQGESVEGR